MQVASPVIWWPYRLLNYFMRKITGSTINFAIGRDFKRKKYPVAIFLTMGDVDPKTISITPMSIEEFTSMRDACSELIDQYEVFVINETSERDT